MNMSGDWRKFIGSFKWLSSSFKSSRELGLSFARPASRFHSSTLFFTFSNISSVQGRISCTVPKHFKPNAEQKFTFKKKLHIYIIRNSLGLSDFFSRDNACEICSNRVLPHPTPYLVSACVVWSCFSVYVLNIVFILLVFLAVRFSFLCRKGGLVWVPWVSLCHPERFSWFLMKIVN